MKKIRHVTPTETIKEEYLVCDYCKKEIIKAGKNWYVIQYFTGEWFDKDESVNETHLCSDICFNKFNEENQ